MESSGQSGSVHWPALKLGRAISNHGLTFVPICEEEAREPGYLLLEDALQEKVARVKEVSEEGSIPVLEVENLHLQPILALQGEELVGSKQDRTLNVTILLPPGRTRIPVTCVEQGRWGYKGRESSSGMIEHLELRRLKAELVTSSRKKNTDGMFAKYMANQALVWNEVAAQSFDQAVHSETGSLGDVYGSGRVKKELDEIEEGICLPEHSRGVVVGVGEEVVAVELLETARLFRRVWPRLLRSYALSTISTQGSAGESVEKSPSPEKVQALLSMPQTIEPAVEESIGLGHDVRWEAPDALAAALIHEGRLLHGTVYSRQGSGKNPAAH
jgi:hypothetical protein